MDVDDYLKNELVVNADRMSEKVSLDVHLRSIHAGKTRKNLLGENLRKMRESAGMTHAVMVRELQSQGWELDPATFSRIENGQRTLTDLEIYAVLAVLGKKWADLDA